MKTLLSIIIPTYNRNKKAVENVKRILPQLTSNEVEIVLLDNCSTTPIEQTLRQELTDSEMALVTVVRNITNIGMSGNSLRIFEVGKGDYIWSLCDDDNAQPDAVENVLKGIRENMDCSYLWFPVNGGPLHRRPGRYRSIGAAIRAEPNLFFVTLSSCVFNREFFTNRLRIGYLYSYSWAAFMCPLLSEMDNEKNIVFISNKIVAEAGMIVATEKWSKLDACLGMRTLLELPMSIVSRRYLQKSIDSFTFSTSRLFLDSLALSDHQRWYLFRIFLGRRHKTFSIKYILWTVFSLASESAPGIIKSIVKFSEKFTNRKLIIEVEDRFERS